MNEIILKVNDTEKELNQETTILELFKKQVQMAPDAVAVIFDNKTMTYKEFDEKTNSLAFILREKGIKPNDLVAIIADRSFQLILGIFAIMKSGAAYVPIAKDNPISRTQYILSESNCKALLCEKEISEALNCAIDAIDIFEESIYKQNTSNLEIVNNGDHLAYVIYTSGSTGKPKGVMIDHKALYNRLNWMQESYPINQNDTLIQKTPYTFDVSVWEMFWWAITGAKLFVMNPHMERFPQAIISGIEENHVSVMHFVPSMFDVFLKYLTDPDVEKLVSLKRIFCSGEELSVNQVKLFNETLYLKNKTRLTNLYGPTEATIDVSYYDCPTDGQFSIIPVGKPIYNTKLLILDEKGDVLPIGEIGEICILGIGLSRGYINREELTKEVFVCSKVCNGKTMYKTGDLGRWLEDGNIEYMGRKDHQVKISGLRIELLEIERVIESFRMGLKCVVVTNHVSDSITYINAFIEKNNEINILELKKYLKINIPSYMIPNNFVFLDTIPLTSNGKADRKYLQSLNVRNNKIMEGQGNG